VEHFVAGTIILLWVYYRVWHLFVFIQSILPVVEAYPEYPELIRSVMQCYYALWILLLLNTYWTSLVIYKGWNEMRTGIKKLDNE